MWILGDNKKKKIRTLGNEMTHYWDQRVITQDAGVAEWTAERGWCWDTNSYKQLWPSCSWFSVGLIWIVRLLRGSNSFLCAKDFLGFTLESPVMQKSWGTEQIRMVVPSQQKKQASLEGKCFKWLTPWSLLHRDMQSMLISFKIPEIFSTSH